MTTRRTLPASAIFMLLVLALAALGVAYGLWSRTLTIRGVVNTGSVNTRFSLAFTDDDGRVNDPALDFYDTGACAIGSASCDPKENGPEHRDNTLHRYDKGVAECLATLTATGDNGTLRTNNGYPGYFCTGWFDINNNGSIPVKIGRATINNIDVIPGLPMAFDLDNADADNNPSTGADVAVYLTNIDLCQQIDPGQTVRLDVDQQILSAAPQNSSLAYTIRLQFNQWNETCTPPQATLPTYTVTQSGLTPAQAQALSDALGLPGGLLGADGALRFTSDRFLAVPMVSLGEGPVEEEKQAVQLEAFNLDALKALQPLGEAQATRLFEDGLAKAALRFDQFGPLTAQSSPGHSTLLAVDAQGRSLLGDQGVRLDTHVSYNLALGQVPLVGQGASVKAVFDPTGQLTQLTFALRGVAQGPAVPVATAGQARELCLRALSQQVGALGEEPAAASRNLTVRSQLVYYAPPLALGGVKTLFPHYTCDATLMIGDQTVQLRRLLVPASQSGPQAALTANLDGSVVSAQAAVNGGTPPYTYQWNSSSTAAPLPNASQISYQLIGSQGKLVGQEVVSVVVVDANGLTAAASQALTTGVPIGFAAPGKSAGLASMLLVPGGLDVGTEWIGLCGGLGGSAGNAAGFVNRFSGAGVPVRFNWGEGNAWERDFIDPSRRGDGLDGFYVDNADFVFYTGHANGNGFSFCSAQSDTFLGYGDGVRWGNNPDLEWLIIAACGPLQLESGGQRWWQRWGPTFDGLHLFMGYQTITYDNTDEGRLVAQYSLAGWTVRNAWIQTAIDVQGPSEVWAVMGVIGPGGWVNYNDHLWGYGSVGPDIRGGDLHGWWIIWGPS